jgi:putative redox protein
MVNVDITYKGKLRTECKHEPSGHTILTDAPKDNQGEGAYFSPTDLVGTALGACMLTLMGIVAQRDGFELGNATAHVEKEMTASPPRKIAKLTVVITVPAALTPEQQEKLKSAAMTCPVKRSLHPDIELPIQFNFAGVAV